LEIQLIAGSGYGMLNPINLRENGWRSDMWLQVVDSTELSYEVELPSGYRLWVVGRDIKDRR